jgi:sarcosine oxidase subunit alpha
MDHHRMMTGSRIGNELFLKLVREMGGSGLLPDRPAATVPPVRDLAVDLCIVGAGPAGLSAAAAAAGPGRRVLVVDEQDRPGGSLLAEPGGVARGQALADAARAAGVRAVDRRDGHRLLPRGSAGGAGGGAARGAGADHRRPVPVRHRRLRSEPPLPDCDRPGMLSARACGRLVFRWGARPGRKVTVISDPGALSPYAATLAEGLARLGIPVAQASIEALPRLDLKRDVAAVAALPAPASELPRQHGARVHLEPARGGFAVEVDGGFATTAPGVYAAGDVTGYRGPKEAAAGGAAAGQAVAGALK